MSTTITDRRRAVEDRQRAVEDFRHYLGMAAHHRPRWNADHTGFICGDVEKHQGWLDMAHDKRIWLMAQRYAPGFTIRYMIQHHDRYWANR